MNERKAFLRAIDASPDDPLVRLVFADWLEEHGELEEAERQRKWPEAMEWLQNICNKLNAGQDYDHWTCDRLLDFGRNVSATTSMNIEVSNDIPDGRIVEVIRDRIPEFWKAWSVITGLALTPELERKCYYASGYCCAHEVYPDTHVAGPKSPEFIRTEELEAEEFQRQLDEEAARQKQLEDEAAERQQREIDKIQDDLEKDRP